MSLDELRSLSLIYETYISSENISGSELSFNGPIFLSDNCAITMQESCNGDHWDPSLFVTGDHFLDNERIMRGPSGPEEMKRSAVGPQQQDL